MATNKKIPTEIYINLNRYTIHTYTSADNLFVNTIRLSYRINKECIPTFKTCLGWIDSILIIYIKIL